MMITDDGRKAKELAKGYGMMAEAIIERAKEDYINSYRMLNNDRGQIRTMNAFYKHKLTIKECERFFTTGWIRSYVEFDSEKLIERLKQEALNK